MDGVGIEYESVVDHPLDEVFAWHLRPGAMPRLVPPWQPMKVVAETSSVADGRAILGLPGGLRWIAQHQGADFDPPHRFVDQLSSAGLRSWPPRIIGKWRHTHDFSARGPDATLVHDRVEAPIPAFGLKADLRLSPPAARRRPRRPPGGRHGRPAADHRRRDRGVRSGRVRAHGVAHHRRSPSHSAGQAPGVRPGRTTLGPRLARVGPVGRGRRRRAPRGHVDRGPVHRFAPCGDPRQPHRADPPPRRSRCVQCGWPRERSSPPRRSATTDSTAATRCLTEDSARGDGFLADVVADWEAAAVPAAAAGLRVVAIRTGIVQAARGGTLKLMRPLFAAGLGGRLGSGQQWLSWIAIDDLIDIYYRALYDERLAGPVNAVAPNPVRNVDYTAALARTLHRPAVLPVPAAGAAAAPRTSGSA